MWPVLLRADGAADPPDGALAIKAHSGDDFVTHECTEGTAATLQALQPRTVRRHLSTLSRARPRYRRGAVTHACTEGTAATLQALDRRSSPAPCSTSSIYSVASAANASFSCPYHAVQTCVLWFTAVIIVINAVGLSFVSMLLSSTSSWPTAPGRARR